MKDMSLERDMSFFSKTGKLIAFPHLLPLLVGDKTANMWYNGVKKCFRT